MAHHESSRPNHLSPDAQPGMSSRPRLHGGEYDLDSQERPWRAHLSHLRQGAEGPLLRADPRRQEARRRSPMSGVSPNAAGDGDYSQEASGQSELVHIVRSQPCARPDEIPHAPVPRVRRRLHGSFRCGPELRRVRQSKAADGSYLPTMRARLYRLQEQDGVLTDVQAPGTLQRALFRRSNVRGRRLGHENVSALRPQHSDWRTHSPRIRTPRSFGARCALRRMPQRRVHVRRAEEVLRGSLRAASLVRLGAAWTRGTERGAAPLDAANSVIWSDDAQISDVIVRKRVGAQGEAPYVRLTTRSLA